MWPFVSPRQHLHGRVPRMKCAFWRAVLGSLVEFVASGPMSPLVTSRNAHCGATDIMTVRFGSGRIGAAVHTGGRVCPALHTFPLTLAVSDSEPLMCMALALCDVAHRPVGRTLRSSRFGRPASAVHKAHCHPLVGAHGRWGVPLGPERRVMHHAEAGV